MDIIYIKEINGQKEMGFLNNYIADFQIGIENDFEIEMPLPDNPDKLLFKENKIKTTIYIEGTEWGGEITGAKIQTGDNTITYTGRTWRGMLEQFIIEPPYGHDYLVVSGTLSNIVRALPMMPDCVVQPCSYHVSNFQFDRYIKTAQGIQDLLNTHSDLQLEIRYEVLENTYQGQIILLIKPKKNLTQLIEFSQDYDNKINLTITQDGNTPRRLICLGEGELKNRKVINLYADENWNIVKVGPRNTFPVETYEYSSSNSLIVDGVKHFRELIANHQQIEITIEDSSLNLGDIISAKDILTETYIQAEISGIILKKTKNTSTDEETIEYQTKVRSRI